MIKVVGKLRVNSDYVLSLNGDVERINLGDIVSDPDGRYRIKSIGMPHYHNPEDIKYKAEVLAEKL